MHRFLIFINILHTIFFTFISQNLYFINFKLKLIFFKGICCLKSFERCAQHSEMQWLKHDKIILKSESFHAFHEILCFMFCLSLFLHTQHNQNLKNNHIREATENTWDNFATNNNHAMQCLRISAEKKNMSWTMWKKIFLLEKKKAFAATYKANRTH